MSVPFMFVIHCPTAGRLHLVEDNTGYRCIVVFHRREAAVAFRDFFESQFSGSRGHTVAMISLPGLVQQLAREQAEGRATHVILDIGVTFDFQEEDQMTIAEFIAAHEEHSTHTEEAHSRG